MKSAGDNPAWQGVIMNEGRRLFAQRWGSGRPTVVFETGSLMPGTNDPGWQPIRDAVCADASAFFYDRAGLGHSDPAPLPRPLASFTADLRAALRGSGTQPPFVLVGGSFGGMLVLNYASLYPEEVTGILLVDSTHPEHNRRVLEILPTEVSGEPPALRDFRVQLWKEEHAPLETNEWEGLDVPHSIIEARAWNLHAIPLIVLTAGIDAWDEGFPQETAARYEQVWLDLQKEMAALSTRSRHIIIEDSDHIIHARRPDVVIQAIRDLNNPLFCYKFHLQ